MVARARRVVIIADSSKLGGHAFARICPIERVETLVTDSGAAPETVDAFRAAGVRRSSRLTATAESTCRTQYWCARYVPRRAWRPPGGCRTGDPRPGKTYRSRRRGTRQALDGFDMQVEAGQVHGFLGPNGSGKTTTLRTLLGLIRPNGGRMTLLGQEVPAALPEVAGRVGAIVESPQFFPQLHRAGHPVAARRRGRRAAGSGSTEVLELVGLRDRAERAGQDVLAGHEAAARRGLGAAQARRRC